MRMLHTLAANILCRITLDPIFHLNRSILIHFNIVQHVIASCILHNICQEGDAEYVEEWDTRDALSDDMGFGNARQIRNVLSIYSRELRMALAATNSLPV